MFLFESRFAHGFDKNFVHGGEYLLEPSNLALLGEQPDEFVVAHVRVAFAQGVGVTSRDGARIGYLVEVVALQFALLYLDLEEVFLVLLANVVHLALQYGV